MGGLIFLLLLGGALTLIAAIAMVARSLTHPPRRTYGSAIARGLAGDPSELDPPRLFEAWSFTSRGLDLPVWDIPGDDPAGPIVVLVHGWGDSRIGGLVRLFAVLPVASRVILWDLPGHGEAPGTCALGTREADDLRSLLATIKADVPIVLFGWSLGAGLAIELAAGNASDHERARIAGVIAEAPYRFAITPARRVMHLRRLPHRLNLPPAFWLLGMRFGVGARWTRFDRAIHAANLSCPLMLIHGTDDEVCPIDDSRSIARAVPHGTPVDFTETESAGHNDLWTDPRFAPQHASAVQRFIRERVAGASVAHPDALP